MPETDHGIVYPESTDHTRLWEHYQNLAESVDTVFDTIPVGAAGIVTVPTPTAGVDGTVEVTFPAGRFISAPVVVTQVQTAAAPSNYYSAASNRTATGCRIVARKASGSVQSLVVMWIAMPQTEVAQ